MIFLHLTINQKSNEKLITYAFVFLVVNLVVNGQEIIKTKPITQIQIKSPTIRPPEARSGKPGNDTTIRICSPSRAGHLAQNQPLYVIIYGNKQLKTLPSHPVMTFKPNWISKINVLKDEKSIQIYGLAAKNGVIVIEIKDEFIKDFKKLLKKQESI